MMFSLEGKTALVTGASGGIGSSIAYALAKQGARLALSGSNADKLRAFREQLNDEFGNCAPLTNPDEELQPTLETPSGMVPLSLKQATVDEVQAARQSSKKNVTSVSVVAVGAYEIASPMELTQKGEHHVTILLHGEPRESASAAEFSSVGT